MGRDFKIFTYLLGVGIAFSIAYNTNRWCDYYLFDKSVSERVWGISYSIPMVSAAWLIYRRAARNIWERRSALFFCFIASSAFMDELFFDPLSPDPWEYLTAFVSLLLARYYERIKEARD